MGGRPTILTKKLGEEICRRLTSGDSLREICDDDEKMPDRTTVYRWLRRIDGDDLEHSGTDLPEEKRPLFAWFCHQFAQAREDQEDGNMDRLQTMSNHLLDGGAAAKGLTSVDVQAMRAAADIMVTKAEKMQPKRYGKKVDVQQNVRTSSIKDIVGKHSGESVGPPSERLDGQQPSSE